jgi:hypothetical protein
MSELDLYAGRTARLSAAIVCQGLVGDDERCGKVL